MADQPVNINVKSGGGCAGGAVGGCLGVLFALSFVVLLCFVMCGGCMTAAVKMNQSTQWGTNGR